MDPKELRGLMEAYSEVYAPQEEIEEAVKGASRHDTEMRKASSAERRKGEGQRLSPSKGKQNADKMERDVKYMDKLTKNNKIIVGMAHEEVGQVDEASPIYSRGGEQRRTQTPRQIGVKSAPHNIPRGGTTISDRDPQGKRLFTGDQDRGKGSKAARRAAALKNEELDIFDVVLEFLQVEGFAETLEEAEWLMANVIDEEAIGIILGEAEGSYGQTPKARAAMGKLAVSRMNKPASEYSQRGEKTRKLKAAERHTRRQDRLASGNNRHGSRGPMDQARRDWSRGADDYGHSGYDGDGYGGSVTKNPKKLRKQKAMGEIAKENYGEEFVDESQYARNNPEKYEREQSKKSAPVRGERTPMPPRGDKRREDFEKWYAANVR
jgi:hypothetical protein